VDEGPIGIRAGESGPIRAGGTMGKVIAKLAGTRLPRQTIFGERFVVECCESFHVH
jgi:hypothetical protein